MLEINSGFNVQTQTEVRNQNLHDQAVHAVGKNENDPLRKDNETTVAITGIEKTETDGTENLYAHQRHQAIAALRDLSGKADADEQTQDDSLKNTADNTSDKVKDPEEKEEDTTKQSGVENDKKSNGEVMTDEEQEQVDKLKARDKEVKTHEEAHMSAAGGLATGPYYDYENGPDGKRYATGGHVNIDTSEEDTPEKTISKMEKVIASANAPAEPSSQDRNVAAKARQTMADARMAMAKEQTESAENKLKEGKESVTQNNENQDAAAEKENPDDQVGDKPKAGNTTSSMSE